MLKIQIPRRGDFEFEHLVLDVNGTLACDGRLIPGIVERIDQLRTNLAVHLLSADTHGSLEEIARELGVPAERLRPSEPEPEQKAAFIRTLNPTRVVAIGNGANDTGMLGAAAIGIAVLGPEGLAAEVLAVADVIVRSPIEALDLLLYPQRLIATLRRYEGRGAR